MLVTSSAKTQQSSSSLKEINLKDEKYLVSFDGEALFPSILLKKCINSINNQLKKSPNFHKHTYLTSDDITDLIKLCFSSSDFVYKKTIYFMKDSGLWAQLYGTNSAKIDEL